VCPQYYNQGNNNKRSSIENNLLIAAENIPYDFFEQYTFDQQDAHCEVGLVLP